MGDTEAADGAEVASVVVVEAGSADLVEAECRAVAERAEVGDFMKRQHMGKMSLRSLLGPVSLWLFAPMLLGLVDSRNQNRAPIAVFIVLGIALLAVIFILVLTIPISAEELKYARFGGFGGFGGFRGYGRFGGLGRF